MAINGGKEGFRTCVHINVAFCWLGCCVIIEVLLIVRVSIDFSKFIGDVTGSDQVVHFNFYIDVSSGQFGVRCLGEGLISKSVVVIAVDLDGGVPDSVKACDGVG